MVNRSGCFSVFVALLVVLTGLALAIMPALSPGALAAAPASVAPPEPALSPQYSVGISPVLELLAGVQSQTDWTVKRGPQGGGSEYFRALQAFFAPYRDHAAMKTSAKLLKSNFAYDAPVAFALHLGPLPDLELQHEYSADIIERAGGRDKLEEFRLALKDLAAQSGFADFLQQWQPEYDEWTAKVTRDFDGNRVIAWLQDFAGSSRGEYQLVLAPAMFPGGGYGTTVTTADGETITYQIIRDWSDGGPEPVFPDGRNLEGLALHEWGHSFVNPAVDSYPTKVIGLWRFFLPVFPAMRSQAYGVVSVYAREQFLRAVTTLASDELYGSAAAESDIAYNESRNFMLTRPIYEALKEYRANRATYPTFASFVPVVYARIAKVPGGWPLPLIGLAFAAVLAALVALGVRARRRRARTL